MEKGKYLKLQAQKRAKEKSSERLGCLVSIIVTGFLGVLISVVAVTLLVSHGEFRLGKFLLGGGLLSLAYILFKCRPAKPKTGQDVQRTAETPDADDLVDLALDLDDFSIDDD